jgi:hypothetical protein
MLDSMSYMQCTIDTGPEAMDRSEAVRRGRSLRVYGVKSVSQLSCLLERSRSLVSRELVSSQRQCGTGGERSGERGEGGRHRA